MCKGRHKIRIYMVHPNIHDEKGLYAFLQLDHAGELAYEFIWDADAPQFLVATDLIYTDPAMRKKFDQMYHNGVVTIFIATECVAPDFNLFDYAVCFDDSLGNGRVAGHVHRKLFRPFISKRENDFSCDPALAEDALRNKEGFCNFIYSNANGHKNRERMFEELNAYKKVDSLGIFLNNTGYSEGCNPNIVGRVRNSVALKSKYKFTIAFENATHRGYTSEKLYTSLEAHSIPIYWGNPEIGKIVNEKAIINCHQYENFDQVVERVKEIDSDDGMWREMACEPWLTKEQEIEERKQEEKYCRFLEEIFLHGRKTGAHALLNGGTKRGSGTFTDMYRDFFFGSNALYERKSADLELCVKWIRLLHKGKSIAEFVAGGNYKTVAIYGMGMLGTLAYEELEKHEGIEIYGLDRSYPAIPSHMRCLRTHEANGILRPDLVIVTVMWDFDSIKKEMDKVFGCDIYSISEIIETLGF